MRMPHKDPDAALARQRQHAEHTRHTDRAGHEAGAPAQPARSSQPKLHRKGEDEESKYGWQQLLSPAR